MANEKTVFPEYDASTLARMDAYLRETFRPADGALEEIRVRAAHAGLPPIHVGKLDALHLEVLARAAGAKHALEVGTLAGLSGVALLRGMGEGSKLVTLEYEPKHAEVARETFRKNGFESQAEIHVGSGLETMARLKPAKPFDLVFIDADKENYPGYARWAVEHLRVGGMLIGDNTLGWGMIANTRFDDAEDERAIRGLREFNTFLASSGRFRATMLPTGEGLTVGVKLR